MSLKAIGKQFSVVLLITKSACLLLQKQLEYIWFLHNVSHFTPQTRNSWDIRLLMVACYVIK